VRTNIGTDGHASVAATDSALGAHADLRETVTTAAPLVIGGSALLVRGRRNDPFARVAPVVPAWRLVLASPGPLTWRDTGRPEHAPTLLVPPEVPIQIEMDAEVAVLHLDAGWHGPQPVPAGSPAAPVPLFALPRHLTEALWNVVNGEELDQITGRLVADLTSSGALPERRALDPRITEGLDIALEGGSIAEAATTVGLSRARFSRLTSAQLGGSPRRLRAWHRLCAALRLQDLDLASAAVTAGFTDQPHLTRTCVRLLGASPGRLRAPRSPARG